MIDDALLRPFVEQLRREAFALDGWRRGPELVGAEVEFIPVHDESGRIAAIDSPDEPSTLPVLRTLAPRFGWSEHRSAKAGVPELRTPNGGRLTFEPGGQLEYAAAPRASVSALLGDLRDVAAALREWCARSGITLLSCGIDPLNDIGDVPMQLHAGRYRRMDRHFASIGPDGARMMRQTASIQISLDAGARPLERWRLLNALAPYLVAMFGNSPVYAGESTGHQSERRRVWGALDPDRTGLAFDEAAPVTAYARFAMRAGAILLGDESEPSRPFADHVRRAGAGIAEWRAHLTTLFPEVRPRGYFEIRSTDALDPAWYAAPLVLLAGLAQDPEAAGTAAEIAGAPDPELLERAGRWGLGDPHLAGGAARLARLALTAGAALGDGVIQVADLETARAFFERYTWRGRSPAGDLPAHAVV